VHNSVRTAASRNVNELEADGLCNPIKECGCPIEELAPCGCVYLNECVAAYKSGKNHYAAIETYGQALLLTA